MILVENRELAHKKKKLEEEAVERKKELDLLKCNLQKERVGAGIAKRLSLRRQQSRRCSAERAGYGESKRVGTGKVAVEIRNNIPSLSERSSAKCFFR